MINLMTYMGMSLQSELCLWNMLGLVTTIFDATLFKVNANLKQVWAMEMPSELSMPVQRGLRTMISGIMLVQCFTVYIYLASYIVMLYPIYLEERPALLLPWLLLAAVKKLLCELMSLALGLGTCVLIGPARSACIKFVLTKIASLLPSFYMWLLVFSYYNTLKLPNVFMKYPVVRPSGSDQDYGLELAVRRRRTKSLLDEKQLRSKLLQSIKSSQSLSMAKSDLNYRTNNLYSTRGPTYSETSDSEIKNDTDIARPFSIASNIELMEDWFGSELAMPRDTDRVVNQFSLMLLRIAAFINSGESDTRKFLLSQSTKTSYDEDTIPTGKKHSYRTTYRKSEAPTMKSDEAVVSLKCDFRSCNIFSFSGSDNEDVAKNHTLPSSTKYNDPDAVISLNSKENSLPWGRMRKAKSFKLNQMLRRRGLKHSKVKVSQSIIDLINRCRKDVQEKLKVKKVDNCLSFIDAESNKTSTGSNTSASPLTMHQSTHFSTNYQTYDQSTSASIPRNERIEDINTKSKIDKGVSTHDKVVSKSQKVSNNISSVQALTPRYADVEKYIDVQSTLSEEIMLQENIEESYSSASYNLTSQSNTENENSKVSMKLRNEEDHESTASEVQNSYEDQNFRYSKSQSNTLIAEDEAHEEMIKSKILNEYTGSSDISSENMEMEGMGTIKQQENSNINHSTKSTDETLQQNTTDSKSHHSNELIESENTFSAPDAAMSQASSEEKNLAK